MYECCERVRNATLLQQTDQYSVSPSGKYALSFPLYYCIKTYKYKNKIKTILKYSLYYVTFTYIFLFHIPFHATFYCTEQISRPFSEKEKHKINAFEKIHPKHNTSRVSCADRLSFEMKQLNAQNKNAIENVIDTLVFFPNCRNTFKSNIKATPTWLTDWNVGTRYKKRCKWKYW